MPVPNLLTVKQFSERHPAFSEPAIRFLIFRARIPGRSGRQHLQTNGLEEAGAIVRIGRRVLIDEARFFQWVSMQQPRRRARAGQL